MKKATILIACLYVFHTNAQENQGTIHLSDMGNEMDKTESTQITYQNSTYESGSYTLSDGSRISYMKKVGISEQEQNNTEKNKLSLSIHPNPSDGNFDLQLTTYDLRLNNAALRIYNVLGEIVYQQTLNFKQETLNTKLTKGVYFLQLQSEEGVVSQKIVVQ